MVCSSFKRIKSSSFKNLIQGDEQMDMAVNRQDHMDVLNRYQEYKECWDRHRIPGESRDKKLLWEDPMLKENSTPARSKFMPPVNGKKRSSSPKKPKEKKNADKAEEKKSVGKLKDTAFQVVVVQSKADSSSLNCSDDETVNILEEIIKDSAVEKKKPTEDANTVPEIVVSQSVTPFREEQRSDSESSSSSSSEDNE